MDRGWDNQLDNMLDDLQATVHSGGLQQYNGGLPFGGSAVQNSVQSSSDHTGDDLNGGLSHNQVVESSAGPGHKSKQSFQYSSEWRTTEGGANDLSSIEKVRSVSKLSSSSNKRVEYTSNKEYVTSNTTNQSIKGPPEYISNTTQQSIKPDYISNTTQQSIKKNIHDLDHLLNNLSANSSRDVSPSLRLEHREGSRSSHHAESSSRTSHVSRSEERREKLIQNTLSRTPSLNRRRPTNLPTSRPTTPLDNSLDAELSYKESHQRTQSPFYKDHTPNGGNQSPFYKDHTPNGGNQSPFYQIRDNAPSSGNQSPFLKENHTAFSYSKQSTTSVNNEFYPVHTVPDPLTGRYADGRITPNHGYTRQFHDPNTKGSDPNSIPKRPDELLHTLGQEIDQRELDEINHNERVTVEKINNNNNKKGGYVEPTISKPGPPVFYPTEEMYQTSHRSEGAMYAASKGSSYKKDSEEKGGAAVIPICLPLCCAAPCVIL